jgi:glycosyltransferase involved in cell wall biosynthesis
LETVAILKKKYHDIFFTGICSESRYAKIEHQIYYNELISLISKLDLNENVSLIRGFQSEKVLDAYLRSNKVAIFPYVSSFQHEVFGASGAARLAMSAGLPVITSSVNHFIDLCSIKADTPEQMASELDKLFSDKLARQLQIDRQNQFIIDNSWAKIAKKYIEIFEL